MNTVTGEATVTIDGHTYKLSGPIRVLREIAKDDARITVSEPIEWPMSIRLRIDEDCSRRLLEWMEKISSLYVVPEAQETEPRRRRAQWKDEQSRYGRKR